MKRIAEHLFFVAVIFMLFLLLFESRIVVPVWLQVLGRMHPLFLHFPIVLLLLALFLEMLPARDAQMRHTYDTLGAGILLAGGLSAALAAIMGLLLSHEEGYTGPVLNWHKWSGAGLVLLSALWYWCRYVRGARRWFSRSGALLSAAALIMAGHWGASLTHGNDFLLAPVTSTDKRATAPVALEDALVFDHLVKPVLEEKCMGCHNPSKAKGGLVMSTPEALLKGGKTGPLWMAGNPAASLLLQRIHLPLEEKKHMPPSGKPQLTDEEIQLLHHWVKAGAGFDQAVAALPAADTLRILAQQRLQTAPAAEPVYNFAAADEKVIRRLNNNYRVIYPVALHSPALVVNFYNREQYSSKALSALLPLKQQIVGLHLQKMPVQDEDLQVISRFEQLETLNLGFTAIKGNTLGQLAALPRLRLLTLSGTAVTRPQLQPLLACKSLKTVYLWNTGLSPEDFTQLSGQYRHIAFIKGFKDDGSQPLKLNPPLLENPGRVFTGSMALALKHPIRGVEIRYTTDGSIPDSLQSPLFKPGALLTANTVIKAKAYKPGWHGSDMVQFSFYKTTHLPDSIRLVTPPASKYGGEGGQTLIDLQKGDMDIGSGKWLGYKDTAMQVLLSFRKPVPVQAVTLCLLSHKDRRILPPARVEIWGGPDRDHLQLLQQARPAPPGPKDKPAPFNLECTFKQASLSYIKIVAVPAGKDGWVFMDEVLVN